MRGKERRIDGFKAETDSLHVFLLESAEFIFIPSLKPTDRRREKRGGEKGPKGG